MQWASSYILFEWEETPTPIPVTMETGAIYRKFGGAVGSVFKFHRFNNYGSEKFWRLV